MRTYTLHILLLVLFTVGFIQANVVLSRFDARTEDQNIIVTWQASIESEVQAYVLERKSTFDPVFKEMTRLQAQGVDKPYTFEDDRVYKAEAGQSALGEQMNYRLRITFLDGSFIYSDPIAVDYTPTAIRRTWGSIKAMFQ